MWKYEQKNKQRHFLHILSRCLICSQNTKYTKPKYFYEPTTFVEIKLHRSIRTNKTIDSITPTKIDQITLPDFS